MLYVCGRGSALQVASVVIGTSSSQGFPGSRKSIKAAWSQSPRAQSGSDCQPPRTFALLLPLFRHVLLIYVKVGKFGHLGLVLFFFFGDNPTRFLVFLFRFMGGVSFVFCITLLFKSYFRFHLELC